MKFILTDSSLDRDSERVLVSGLAIDNFKKNPVMLYQHRQDSYWSGTQAPLPIGYWKNITVTGDQLTAEPEFNDTELAQQVKALVEHGTLNACSIGFRAISYSSDPLLMLPGQKYSTITSAELLEASIVMIPSNPNAVAVKSFSKDGKKYEVNGDSKLSDDDISKLDKAAKEFFQSTKTQFDMTKQFEELKKSLSGTVEKIANALGLEVKEGVVSKKENAPAIDESKLKEVSTEIETVVKSMVKLEEENTSINTAKEAAEASVKTLTTEKETLISEKATLVTEKGALEKEVSDLKAANLKLSGGDAGTEIKNLDGSDKNDTTNADNKPKPVKEVTKSLAEKLADITSIHG